MILRVSQIIIAQWIADIKNVLKVLSLHLFFLIKLHHTCIVSSLLLVDAIGDDAAEDLRCNLQVAKPLVDIITHFQRLWNEPQKMIEYIIFII